MRKIVTGTLLCFLLLNLMIIPLTSYASQNANIQVKGNLDMFEETISKDDSAKNNSEVSEEKQTIIKKGNLPKTGEQTFNCLVVSGIFFIVFVGLYIYRKKKTIYLG